MKNFESLAIAAGLGVLGLVAYKLMRTSKTQSEASNSTGGYQSTITRGVDLTNVNSYYNNDGTRNNAMVLDRWDALALSYQPSFGVRP